MIIYFGGHTGFTSGFSILTRRNLTIGLSDPPLPQVSIRSSNRRPPPLSLNQKFSKKMLQHTLIKNTVNIRIAFVSPQQCPTQTHRWISGRVSHLSCVSSPSDQRRLLRQTSSSLLHPVQVVGGRRRISKLSSMMDRQRQS